MISRTSLQNDCGVLLLLLVTSSTTGLECNELEWLVIHDRASAGLPTQICDHNLRHVAESHLGPGQYLII